MTPILGFAHRGAPRFHAEENTLPAFERALALGAGGLETDIGLTADGVPVLFHAGLSLRRGIRVADNRKEDLPTRIPALAELYDRCGINFELSLDMADPGAAEAVVRVAHEYGAAQRLWLTYWRLPQLQSWRARWPSIHLVYPSVPLRPSATEHLIGRLGAIEVCALNVHHLFCRRGLVDLAHGRELYLFAWGIKRRRSLLRVLELGVDGVFCDDVEGMVQLLGKVDDRDRIEEALQPPASEP